MVIMYFAIGLICLSIVETALSGLWNKAYFAYGVSLYSRTIDSLVHKKADALAESLNTVAGSDKALCLFSFKELDEKTIGFRERFFDFSFNGLRYSPIMHGRISLDPDNSRITIKGKLNWALPVFMVCWYLLISTFNLFEANSIGQGVFYLFLVFPPLICGVSYGIQNKKFNLIVKYLRNAKA